MYKYNIDFEKSNPANLVIKTNIYTRFSRMLIFNKNHFDINRILNSEEQCDSSAMSSGGYTYVPVEVRYLVVIFFSIPDITSIVFNQNEITLRIADTVQQKELEENIKKNLDVFFQMTNTYRDSILELASQEVTQ